MEGNKYECKKCGKSFEVEGKDKAPVCVYCGSEETTPVVEKPAASSYAPRGRFM